MAKKIKELSRPITPKTCSTRLVRRNLVSLVVACVLASLMVVILAAPTTLGGNLSQHRTSSDSSTGSDYFFLGTYDFHTLRGNSSAIVLASVAGINATYQAVTSLGSAGGAVHMDFQLNVLSYLKRSGPQTIFVVDIQLDGSPVPTVGQDYVFFLANSWHCAPSPPSPPCALPPTPLNLTYGIVGGAQGKFLVQNGLVYGFKSLYPTKNYWMKVDADGVPLSQFAAQMNVA